MHERSVRSVRSLGVGCSVCHPLMCNDVQVVQGLEQPEVMEAPAVFVRLQWQQNETAPLVEQKEDIPVAEALRDAEEAMAEYTLDNPDWWHSQEADNDDGTIPARLHAACGRATGALQTSLTDSSQTQPKIRQALHSPADAVTFDDIPDDVAAELLNLPPDTIAEIDEYFQGMPTPSSTIETQHFDMEQTFQTQKAAAIKMQAIFRSVSQTSKYQQARARLIRLQAVYRGVAQKKKYQEARAVIRLQAVYRGVAQKKKYQEARARLTSSEVKKSGTKRKLVNPELVEEAPKKGSRARTFVAPAASQEVVKEPKKTLLSRKSVVPAPVEEQVEAAPKLVLRSGKSGRQREPAPVEEVQEPPKKRSSSRKCVAPAVVEKPVMVREMPARASKAEKKAVRAAPKSKSAKATTEKATALARRSTRRG